MGKSCSGFYGHLVYKNQMSTNHVKALKATQSADPNDGVTGLILTWPSTGLLRKRVVTSLTLASRRDQERELVLLLRSWKAHRKLNKNNSNSTSKQNIKRRTHGRRHVAVSGHLTRELRVLCLLQGSFGELGLVTGIAGTQNGRQGHRADVGMTHTCTLVLDDCCPETNNNAFSTQFKCLGKFLELVWPSSRSIIW